MVQLNFSQEQAVGWREGPLLVLAGPGSGKTRVLAQRIAGLIKDSPDSSFKILGLTFTNALASEMKDCIAKYSPEVERRTTLVTYHSFAAKLLRQHGSHLGLKPSFTILDQEQDRYALLEDAMKGARFRESYLDNRDLLAVITRLTEAGIPLDDAEHELEKRAFPDYRPLAAIYKRYRLLMLESNRIDYPGLIAEARSLLEDHNGISRMTRIVYPYVCVDEFQDINQSQFNFLVVLVDPKHKHLFVLADDDQMKYQWNGASPERIKDLREKFNPKILYLPENHRCPTPVADIANKLIAHNTQRTERGRMTAGSPKQEASSDAVLVRQFRQFEEEVEWVVGQISKCPKGERSERAILARNRKLLGSVSDSLKTVGVESYTATRKSEFTSPPLQWLHSALRLADSKDNYQHLERVCNAFSKLENVELERDIGEITLRACENGGNYLRTWIDFVKQKPSISKSTKDFLLGRAFNDLVDYLDYKKFQNEAFRWLDEISPSPGKENNLFDDYRDEKEVWTKCLDTIRNQHSENGIPLHAVLHELDLRKKSPSPSRHAVPCLTIHSSKGMEFDYVYLIGMAEELLPSWQAASKENQRPADMEEERRNCFVAITRAKVGLIMTYSTVYWGFKKEPSRFLAEMELLN